MAPLGERGASAPPRAAAAADHQGGARGRKKGGARRWRSRGSGGGSDPSGRGAGRVRDPRRRWGPGPRDRVLGRAPGREEGPLCRRRPASGSREALVRPALVDLRRSRVLAVDSSARGDDARAGRVSVLRAQLRGEALRREARSRRLELEARVRGWPRCSGLTLGPETRGRDPGAGARGRGSGGRGSGGRGSRGEPEERDLGVRPETRGGLRSGAPPRGQPAKRGAQPLHCGEAAGTRPQ